MNKPNVVITWTAQDDVEIQTIDTNRWIVFDSQVNVFLNTETKVSAGRKIVTSQFIFAHLLNRNWRKRKLIQNSMSPEVENN